MSDHRGDRRAIRVEIWTFREKFGDAEWNRGVSCLGFKGIPCDMSDLRGDRIAIRGVFWTLREKF